MWKKLTNTGYDCSALSSSHTSGHKPVNVPQAKIADELSCLGAQFTVIQPHHPLKKVCANTHAQSTPLHLIFARSCELVWASLSFSMGLLWDFWQCLLLCALQAWSGQAQAHTHFYGRVDFSALSAQSVNKRVATYGSVEACRSQSYIQDVKQKPLRYWGHLEMSSFTKEN